MDQIRVRVSPSLFLKSILPNNFRKNSCFIGRIKKIRTNKCLPRGGKRQLFQTSKFSAKKLFYPKNCVNCLKSEVAIKQRKMYLTKKYGQNRTSTHL